MATATVDMLVGIDPDNQALHKPSLGCVRSKTKSADQTSFGRLGCVPADWRVGHQDLVTSP